MCKLLEIMKDQAREESKAETAINLFKMGFDIDAIAKGVGYSPEVVRQWLASALTAQGGEPHV